MTKQDFIQKFRTFLNTLQEKFALILAGKSKALLIRIKIFLAYLMTQKLFLKF